MTEKQSAAALRAVLDANLSRFDAFTDERIQRLPAIARSAVAEVSALYRGHLDLIYQTLIAQREQLDACLEFLEAEERRDGCSIELQR